MNVGSIEPPPLPAAELLPALPIADAPAPLELDDVPPAAPGAPALAGRSAAAEEPALGVVVGELAPLPPLAAEDCMAGARVPAFAALPLVAAGIVLAGEAGEPALLLTPLACVGVLPELEQPARHNPPITKNFP